mmetsp:Transcript_3434/g.4787  ORF Transcript_3434/g.4787 Transcript_3434/m.4787 type:complete len:455 (+) Transcript_3434:75-1439(+)|eukprot:CAMPEP_0184871898 /NCGR_PEP_ID=MMETSP0580-20130426/40981_1 /TAXON_ID=1118495 /ORGANISM="Dactyliosolen fragilissimus" /LENGTH=454 /DNA_ID=CAMNT_0027374617 /DNA_START=665 /DNA_END=2029 /DNA_ORIENTATION=-
MFGQPGSGNGDLMLGRAAFEGAVGSGYSNETGSTASASGASIPSNNPSNAFDLKEFPSLGGGGAGNISAAGGENNGLAAALRQQQILAQQQMMQGGSGKTQSSNLYRLAMGSSMGTSLVSTGSNNANFNMATEDFPALPGAPTPSGTSVGNNSSGSGLLGGIEGSQRDMNAVSSTPGQSYRSNAPNTSSSSTNGSALGMYSGEVEGVSNHLDSNISLGTAAGPSSGLSNLANAPSGNNPSINQQQRSTSLASTQPSSAPGVTSSSNVSSSTGGTALSGDFGLLGLLGVIRMSDADRNALALGSDLTTLGLNLNSSDQLYSTFASPWSESPTTREPQYQLPMCYYMQPPALKTGHLSKFQLETLFYIFYALPKDVLQAYAAQELYSREWRYHVDLKLWFKRAGPSDGVTNTGNGLQYIYFDINSWEHRLFNGNMNQNITSGLLSEDDIRVKFTNS